MSASSKNNSSDNSNSRKRRAEEEDDDEYEELAREGGELEVGEAHRDKPTVLTSSSDASDDDGKESSRSSREQNNDRGSRLHRSHSSHHKQANHHHQSSSKRNDHSRDATVSYKDYSHLKPDPSEASFFNTKSSSNGDAAAATTNKEPTFPMKLQMILSCPEWNDIIAWLPHGRSWRILQPKAFEDKVIPLYFRHGRYSSFARQVNGWNFRRITGGTDFNSYYHELFLRGLPHLCLRMKRLTAKDITEKKKFEDSNKNSNNIPAPDFYSMSRVNPLPESFPIPVHGLPLTLTPPAFATKTATANPGAGRQTATKQAVQAPQALRDHSSSPHQSSSSPITTAQELAVLEQRRADVLQRISLLSPPALAQQKPPLASAHATTAPNNDTNMLLALTSSLEGGGAAQVSSQQGAATSFRSLDLEALLASLVGQQVPANTAFATAPLPPPAPPPQPAPLMAAFANNNSGATTAFLQLLQSQQQHPHQKQQAPSHLTFPAVQPSQSGNDNSSQQLLGQLLQMISSSSNNSNTPPPPSLFPMAAALPTDVAVPLTSTSSASVAPPPQTVVSGDAMLGCSNDRSRELTFQQQHSQQQNPSDAVASSLHSVQPTSLLGGGGAANLTSTTAMTATDPVVASRNSGQLLQQPQSLTPPQVSTASVMSAMLQQLGSAPSSNISTLLPGIGVPDSAAPLTAGPVGAVAPAQQQLAAGAISAILSQLLGSAAPASLQQQQQQPMMTSAPYSTANNNAVAALLAAAAAAAAAAPSPAGYLAADSTAERAAAAGLTAAATNNNLAQILLNTATNNNSNTAATTATADAYREKILASLQRQFFGGSHQ